MYLMLTFSQHYHCFDPATFLAEVETCHFPYSGFLLLSISGRGGQSALRFARLRMEKRHNYVRKVAETAVQLYITNDKVCFPYNCFTLCYMFCWIVAIFLMFQLK